MLAGCFLDIELLNISKKATKFAGGDISGEKQSLDIFSPIFIRLTLDKALSR